MQRRDFFSSLGSVLSHGTKPNLENFIRPPYNQEASLFRQACPDCEGLCATACEEEVIKIAEDNTPYLDFSSNGCTFCEACAHACESEVLSLEYPKQIGAALNISVSSCLAWNDTMCFSCKEPCLENAIVFQGLFKPVIDLSKCTACGFCVSRCPSFAIELKVI